MSRIHRKKTPPGQRQRHAGEHEQGVAHVAERHEQQREDQQRAPAAPPLRDAGARTATARTGHPTSSSNRLGSSTLSAIRRSASATNEPMSRPRTLAVTTTRRLPFSRLIWFGPGAISNVATCPRGTNPAPARQRNRQALQPLEVGALRLGQAHQDVEAPVAFEHLPRGAPADRDLHHILHVRDVQPEPSDRRAIDLDRQDGQARRLLERDVGGAGTSRPARLRCWRPPLPASPCRRRGP